MFVKNEDQVMDDIVSSPPSPTRKRAAPEDDKPQEKPLNLKGNQFILPTPPDTDGSSNTGPDDSRMDARAASPAPSSSDLSTIESTSAGMPECNVTSSTTPNTGSTPAKRRKLTPAEKIEKQQLLEAKQRERAASKLQKDEEKRVRDEDKRKKAEEREAKKREKEVEDERKAQKKREKELEEERKAEEKLKRERSQLRLGAFFQAKAVTSPTKLGNGEEVQNGRARRKSLSLEPFDAVADQIKVSASPIKSSKVSTPKRTLERMPSSTVKVTAQSDYRRAFLPFQLPSDTKLAPSLQQNRTEEELRFAQALFDSEVNDPSLQEEYDLGVSKSHIRLDQYFPSDRNLGRGLPILSVRQLIDRIQGTSDRPIDLTDDYSSDDLIQTLQQIPRRHIHFCEDVRPAYCGTYSKITSPRQIRKFCRNPCSRIRPDTDYDYDSEAEWEEPEEGEELLSDDEDEVDDPADVADIETFLDDEDDAMKNKRKIITGDLLPTNTGICWEDSSGHVLSNDQEDSPPSNLHSMSLDIIIPNFRGKTIDPFSADYWLPEPSSTSQSKAVSDVNSLGAMAPPRPPLQPRSNTNASLELDLIGAAEGEKGPITSAAMAKRGRKPAPKTLSTEDLAEFKDAIVGSPLGKLDLLKGLKCRFPKITNETIKETLGSQFAQVGSSRDEKRWVFVG